MNFNAESVILVLPVDGLMTTFFHICFGLFQKDEHCLELNCV